MKTNKTQKDKAAQSLTRTVCIYGHAFTIDMKGDVFTPEYNHIGHIEECRDYAELIHDLIHCFESGGEI